LGLAGKKKISAELIAKSDLISKWWNRSLSRLMNAHVSDPKTTEAH
jgi:hypothetical protein